MQTNTMGRDAPEMSAFVQHSDHVDLLVTAIMRFDVHAGKEDPTAPSHWREISLIDFDEVGRSMIRENVNSVLYRYADVSAEELADYQTMVETYTFDSILPLPPVVALLKAVHGYTYQSCEHPGWDTSDAKALTDALEATLIRSLPGYHAADTWSYLRPSVRATVTEVSS